MATAYGRRPSGAGKEEVEWRREANGYEVGRGPDRKGTSFIRWYLVGNFREVLVADSYPSSTISQKSW